MGGVHFAERPNDDGIGDMATPQTRRLHPGRIGADDAVPLYATPPSTADPGSWAPTFAAPPGHPDDAIPSYSSPPGTADPGDWSPAPAAPPGGPGDGYGHPAGAYPAAAVADGPYGGTWTAGSPYGGSSAPYGVGQPPSAGSTSGWAIASLWAGILGGGLVVLGAVFGSIALGKIHQTGQRGSGQAIAGIVLSGFWAVVLIVLLVFLTGSPSNQATRASNGQINKSGSLSVFSLSVGDCFDNPASQQDISSVTAVPCSQPHDAQVFAKFGLSGSNAFYPANLTQVASNGCNAQENHLNEALVTDSMAIRFIYPVQHAWELGQRTVSCLIVTPTHVSTSLVNS
jgi:hypothetical protein